MVYKLLQAALLVLGAGYGWLPAQPAHQLLGQEHILLAETKQVNQFFRRFNAEENGQGERLYPGDPLYRSPDLRAQYLDMLYDHSATGLSRDAVRTFKSAVMAPEAPFYLDFHGPDWFAEVRTTFNWMGKRVEVVLFMQLEAAEVGSSWVIRQAYAECFHSLFQDAPVASPPFLHPLSHELDFMNLARALRPANSPETYATRGYTPDYLTLLFFEMKRKNLTFISVDEVKFHFFQVPGWYFELAAFNRPGTNRGWLMSNLVPVSLEEKNQLLTYIFYRQ
ncbi:MAG: hypothetical protein SF053_17725 [Bacteroidia bacterium]|nr:hypothetical protein [Bacteroidia bacterium]